jgi:hypothetical protein
MAIYNAEIARIDTSEVTVTVIGRVANGGKMNMFRAMQASGEAVCSIFDDCGEFEFVWNTSAKVWEFFNESGELVGRMKAERDAVAEYAKKVVYYNECKAACEAVNA